MSGDWGPMGPPPYELRLAERPQDRAEFSDLTGWLGYRIVYFRRRPVLGRRKYFRLKREADDLARIFLGRAYGLGRREPRDGG